MTLAVRLAHRPLIKRCHCLNLKCNVAKALVPTLQTESLLPQHIWQVFSSASISKSKHIPGMVSPQGLCVKDFLRICTTCDVDNLQVQFHEKFVSLQQGRVIKNGYLKELVWSTSGQCSSILVNTSNFCKLSI